MYQDSHNAPYQFQLRPLPNSARPLLRNGSTSYQPATTPVPKPSKQQFKPLQRTIEPKNNLEEDGMLTVYSNLRLEHMPTREQAGFKSQYCGFDKKVAYDISYEGKEKSVFDKWC